MSQEEEDRCRRYRENIEKNYTVSDDGVRIEYSENCQVTGERHECGPQGNPGPRSDKPGIYYTGNPGNFYVCNRCGKKGPEGRQGPIGSYPSKNFKLH